MRTRAIAAASFVCAACSAPQAHDVARDTSAPRESTAARTPLERRTLAVPASTVELQFVRIPAAQPFWISTTEITWDAFDVYVYKTDAPAGAEVDAVTRPSQPYNPMDRGFGHAGHPALSMSLKSARGFCAWLSAHTGKRLRLPTEAEWELAARAGDTRARPDDAELAASAWLAENSGARTHRIEMLRANAYGLHDVFGNAGEWCVAPDGTGVLRGGTFQTPRAELGYDTRTPDTPAWNRRDPQLPKSVWWLIDGGFVGLRVVCDDAP